MFHTRGLNLKGTLDHLSKYKIDFLNFLYKRVECMVKIQSGLATESILSVYTATASGADALILALLDRKK